MKNTLRTVGAISIFSVAMAALEGAVVVYLRALYYPGAFTVSLKIMDSKILLVEIVREAATIIMLLSIAYLAGKNFRERLAYFLLSFAIWDIFYYGWLKVFIDWPATFFDWDILFLIPITWIGPVAAPIICSLTMIVLAAMLLKSELTLSKTIWIYLVIGTVLVLFTFTRDYALLIADNGLLAEYPNLMQNEDFVRLATNFFPLPYAWNIFWAGELLFLIAIVHLGISKHINTKEFTVTQNNF
jgi:hypothetical protein